MGTFLKTNNASRHVAFILAIMIVMFLPHTIEAAGIIRAPNNLGLVGYWSFDEGQGTQVSDLSGNGNNGHFGGSPKWTNGVIRNAIELDSSDDYINAGSGLSLNISDEITEAAWVYPTACNDHGTIATKNNAFYLQVHSDCRVAVYTYRSDGGNSTYTYSTSQIPLNTWSYVVFTEDVTGFRSIYINGELDKTFQAEVGIYVNGVPLTIGRQTGSRPFSGKIDEVRIYSRALSATEVTTLYNNSKGVILGNTSSQYTDGLVAHYTFDGSTIAGTAVRDVAGGNNGTISGGVTPVMGKIGQGMNFGGASTDYISIPHSTDFDVSALTLAMWVKTPSTPFCSSGASSCYRGVFSKQGATRDYNFYLHSSNGQQADRLHLSSTGAFGASAHTVPTFASDTWYHVAVTISTSGYFRYYIDGNQVATYSGTSANANSNYPIWIGRADNYWKGGIDDVRVYNRALSPEEVRGLADGGFGVMASKAPFQKGSILMERWEGVGGTSISNIPLHLSPTRTEERTSFEAPVSWGDNYGLRMSGFLYPETTGNYTFWIASDDNGQLWLSTNSTRANKQLIAQVNTYTSSRQWNKESNQKSAEIRLVAGQRYYIEALMKEGGGGDNLAVSWKLNDTTDPPNGSTAYIIPGSFLSPWVD